MSTSESRRTLPVLLAEPLERTGISNHTPLGHGPCQVLTLKLLEYAIPDDRMTSVSLGHQK